MNRYRFQFLLAALFVMILSAPLLPFLGGWSSYAASLFLALMLLAAVSAVAEKKATGLFALGLFVISFTIKIVGVWYLPDPLLMADYLVTVLFIGVVVLMVLKSIFTAEQITFNTICAALSVYLLLAVLWAMLYGMIELADPGSFAYNTTIGGDAPSMRLGDGRSVIPLYFSLVTLTTLGYGDVTPVTPMASTLAVVEALIGQFYLTVLVAWLVGMYIADSLRSKTTD